MWSTLFSWLCPSFSTLGIDGQASLDGPIEEVARMEAQEAEDLLNDLGISVQ